MFAGIGDAFKFLYEVFTKIDKYNRGKYIRVASRLMRSIDEGDIDAVNAGINELLNQAQEPRRVDVSRSSKGDG